MQLLHTPEGVRDIYGEESRYMDQLRNDIAECMKRYGFATIQTPSFEFFDIFNKERGTVPSQDMYKFFDRDNNTLVLRPDMTPAIARCVAKYFRNSEKPIRLSYCGNAFINNSSYQGRLKEFTQMGAELFGDASVVADAEIIAVTIDSLLSAGLKEFQIEIGNAEFFKAIVAETSMTTEQQESLRELIENKNVFGVEDLLRKLDMSDALRSLFLELPGLFGSVDMLREVQQKTDNMRALNALNRLMTLHELLKLYGFEKYVSFDLGMLSKYSYYTGIIFRGLTYGTGEAIVSGGRYNQLAGQFGEEMPAIGMAIMLDQLMTALERQGYGPKDAEPVEIVYFNPANPTQAVMDAAALRAHGRRVELRPESI